MIEKKRTKGIKKILFSFEIKCTDNDNEKTHHFDGFEGNKRVIYLCLEFIQNFRKVVNN